MRLRVGLPTTKTTVRAVAWVAAAKEQFEVLAQKKEEDTRTIQPFWKAVKHLQTNFVFCGCDKSPQTVACVCKKYYKQELQKKLESQAYAPASEDDVLKAAAMKSEERDLDKLNVPYLYILPKFHKGRPAWREIRSTRGKRNFTSATGRKVEGLLAAMQDVMCRESDRLEELDGVHRVLFLTETREAAVYLKENRLLAKGKKLVKTDFATLYTSLKLDKTQRNIEEVVRRCFKIMQDQNETY